MLPPNQSTTNWPPQIDETLIRGTPYQALHGETLPPEVRRATPTKHQPADGSPRLQPESSRISHKARGKGRPMPVVKRDPPVKPARTLPPNNSYSPFKAPCTIVPKNPSKQPALIRAPDKYNPQIKSVSKFTPLDLPGTILLKKPFQCKQCKKPTSNVRDFIHIRPCLVYLANCRSEPDKGEGGLRTVQSA